MRPKEREGKAGQHQEQEQGIEQPNMAIGITQPEFLIKVSHAGTLGPLELIAEYGREESFVFFRHCVAADSARFQVKLVDQYQDSFDPGAHRTNGHRGAGDVGDVTFDPYRIENGLALILGVKPLFPNIAPPRFSEHKELNVRYGTLVINADHVGHRLVLTDRILDDRIAVNLSV